MTHIESAAGFASTVFAAICGAITLPSIAEVVTNDQMPEWSKGLLGPVGASIGMIIIIKWLTARLDKGEAREALRQEKYDSHMVEVLKLGLRCTDVIEQNNRLLEKRQ